jgi:very-short-patch-repair endonuclease
MPGIFPIFPDKQIKAMVYSRKTNEHWIHFGAFPGTFELAKQLRRRMTPAERIMWTELRKQFHSKFKFRRQHPVREFVVDFFCVEKQLVIEIDGGIHKNSDVKERDENRTAELERLGLRVIRFSNDEVLNCIETVIQKIEIELHSPSPFGEGVGG